MWLVRMGAEITVTAWQRNAGCLCNHRNAAGGRKGVKVSQADTGGWAYWYLIFYFPNAVFPEVQRLDFPFSSPS